MDSCKPFILALIRSISRDRRLHLTIHFFNPSWIALS